MKHILFILTDQQRKDTTGASRHLKKHKTHPHCPNRVDQAWTMAEEAARIPAGYKIDIGWD